MSDFSFKNKKFPIKLVPTLLVASAVSFMMYLNNALTMNDLPMYVVAQLTGGAAALYFHKMIPIKA